MSEITELINYLNESGGIPLSITNVTTTNPYQFYITTLIGGFMLIYIFGKTALTSIQTIYAKILLSNFKKKNRLGNLMVIKHTNSDLFSQAMINQNTLKDIQMKLIKFKGKPFDLILWTPGGEIFSATYISRMLKQYKGKIRSFIPIYSMSGGTMLALSTDEIYMNDSSCLGAVDPQLGNLFKFGSARSWKEIVKLKGKKAEDSSIAFKHIGEQYTKSIRENIRELLVNKLNNKKDINKVVKLLTSGEVEHAFNFTKELLRSQGMNIFDIPDETNIKIIKLIRHLPEGVVTV
jgi:ClpP class serine protease